MRSNQERLNSIEVPDKENESVGSPQSADFSFIQANEIVQLPSGGQLYPEGSPLRENPEVEIKQMTAHEEDILTNASYIAQGTVVERLLESLIVRPKGCAQDLLAGDREAILFQARRSAFGDDYEVKLSCNSCGHVQDKVFNIGECATESGVSIPEGVEKTDSGTFVMTAPKSGARVEFRLMTGRDEATLSDRKKKYEKNNIPFSLGIEAYKLLIVSVNDNPAMVSKFVDNAPLADTRAVRMAIQETKPSIGMKGDFKCSKCGYEGVVDVPVTFRFLNPEQ